MRLYYQPSDGWRQVGHDWLAAAERLALKLDNDTNNASLALAFELAGSGKVLLFPGDAQVGNWKSWHQCQWPIAGSPGQALTAAELLRRTVLYKVGHHGSHNATLRQQGLELMESRDLVAMLPVDEKFAHDTYGWGMPFPFLHDRLQEKTGGRLLRADDRQRALGPEPPSGSWLSKKEWKAFRKAVEVKALKVTYTIEG